MIALVVAIAACGGDSTSPPNNSVSGRWTYNASNLTGSGVSCSFFGVSMSLTQSGINFTGSTSGVATITCTEGGQTSTQSAPLSGVVANGLVSGRSVQFDFGTQDFHNVGTLSGNSM